MIYVGYEHTVLSSSAYLCCRRRRCRGIFGDQRQDLLLLPNGNPEILELGVGEVWYHVERDVLLYK